MLEHEKAKSYLDRRFNQCVDVLSKIYVEIISHNEGDEAQKRIDACYAMLYEFHDELTQTRKLGISWRDECDGN